MKPALILAFAALAAPALAQQTEEEARAAATVLPMIQELVLGQDAQLLTACIVAAAQPDERAALAAAPGPSAEMGAIVNAVVARPETIGCVVATKGQ